MRVPQYFREHIKDTKTNLLWRYACWLSLQLQLWKNDNGNSWLLNWQKDRERERDLFFQKIYYHSSMPYYKLDLQHSKWNKLLKWNNDKKKKKDPLTC